MFSFSIVLSIYYNMSKLTIRMCILLPIAINTYLYTLHFIYFVFLSNLNSSFFSYMNTCGLHLQAYLMACYAMGSFQQCVGAVVVA